MYQHRHGLSCCIGKRINDFNSSVPPDENERNYACGVANCTSSHSNVLRTGTYTVCDLNPYSAVTYRHFEIENEAKLPGDEGSFAGGAVDSNIVRVSVLSFLLRHSLKLSAVIYLLMHIFDMIAVTSIFLICACMLLSRVSADPDEVENQEPNLLDEEDPYKTTDPRRREPSPCEVCKYFATELLNRLDETDSKEIIRTGHGLDKKKEFPYKYSELRLTEALLEPHVCDRILEYNVHAERKGSLRYAKGQSETMSTLHGLVNKGVKVELGIPYEWWDTPSAEVTKMQRKCFKLAENYEDDIEEWYFKHQEIDLIKFLCRDRYLKDLDQSCLEEAYHPKGDVGTKKKTKSKKSKNKNQPDVSPSNTHNEL
ncbi:hypothetical protein LSH36_132g00013 [Paralvinella palmiformis]|uniref:DUF3456 domain-containing protein n=1 Tax=Paralvinella palmiformis TaxID=53620 RepID=A0AAD9NAW4_9ANNE|nr:hypothetical protein LSH36_132g00013 [Paralvinella palmiformis]